MEFEKFKQMLLDSKWDAFFDFADTVNLAVGENVYHTCNFCPYHTKHVLNLSYTDDIDDQIARHLFKEHHAQIMAYHAFQIGNAKGQTHLDTESEGTERGQLE